jgi:hypothetical protein
MTVNALDWVWSYRVINYIPVKLWV